MKTQTLFQQLIVGTAIVAASVVTQAQSLSVKDWAKDLKNAVDGHKAAEINRLLDTAAIENSVLKPRDPVATLALEKGRKLYAAGKLDQAIEQYDRVPKGSDLWLDALEEKGWAYFRGGNYERALAQTKTLLSDTFLPVVGSQPFLLQVVGSLKVCDYKAILDTNKLFKETQKARLTAIQDLADTGSSPAFVQVIAKSDRFPLSLEDYGAEAKMLPKGFYRDVPFQRALLRIRMAAAAGPVLQGTPQAVILSKLEKNALDARATVKERMKKMARAETDDNFKVIQKLNIVEVETIQRVHIDKGVDKKTYQKGQFAETASDDLIFPDDGHPWIDELDKAHLKLNECPQNVRRKM